MHFLLLSALFLISCSSSPPAKEPSPLSAEARKGIKSNFITHRKQISDCYGEAILKKGNEDLAGKLTVKFKINKDGSTSHITSVPEKTTLSDSDLFDCIKGHLSGWTFPIPDDKTEIDVTYPLVFSKDAPKNMQNKLDYFEKLKK